MRLSTSVSMLGKSSDVPVPEAMRRLSEAGFEVLDFPFCNLVFDGSPFLDDDWRDWIRDVRRVADDLGVAFSQGHGPWGIIVDSADRAQRDRMVELSRRSMEAGAALGVRWMAFHPETWGGPHDLEHYRSLKQYNIDLFAEVLRSAGEFGVGIAVENTKDRPKRGNVRMFGSVPAELIEVVDALASPLVGVCWDTGHAEMEQLDHGAAIRSIGRRLKALHINDNYGQFDQHLLPFSGTVDWEAVVGALKAIDYEGDFTFEAASSVVTLPRELHDSILRHAVEIGTHLISRA